MSLIFDIKLICLKHFPAKLTVDCDTYRVEQAREGPKGPAHATPVQAFLLCD